MTAEAEAWSYRGPRPALRYGASLTTNSPSWPTRSTACSTVWRPACGGSSASRPRSLTSCVRRWPRSRQRRSWPCGVDATGDYYQEALGSVLYSADQMARTVEALLAAAQEEGSLARGRADVWQVIADVVSSIGVLAEENGVEVRVQTSRPRPARGCGTRHRRADPAAGGGERLPLRPVGRAPVSRRARVRRCYFVVEDDGPGVAEEESEQIFEPGVRGSASGNERQRAREASAWVSPCHGAWPGPPPATWNWRRVIAEPASWCGYLPAGSSGAPPAEPAAPRSRSGRQTRLVCRRLSGTRVCGSPPAAPCASG